MQTLLIKTIYKYGFVSEGNADSVNRVINIFKFMI